MSTFRRPSYVKKYPIIPKELLRDLIFKLSEVDGRYIRELDCITQHRVGNLAASMINQARLNNERVNTLQVLRKLFVNFPEIVNSIDKILALNDKIRSE